MIRDLGMGRMPWIILNIIPSVLSRVKQRDYDTEEEEVDWNDVSTNEMQATFRSEKRDQQSPSPELLEGTSPDDILFLAP